jgi:hypothetical protein
MTTAQKGLYLEILMEQWVYGDVPRSAWQLHKQINPEGAYSTTLRFLSTYSHLLVCRKCSESWTKEDCKCGESNSKGKCHNRKLHFLRIDVISGLELGTTEPNLNSKPNLNLNTTSDDDEVESPTPKSSSDQRPCSFCKRPQATCKGHAACTWPKPGSEPDPASIPDDQLKVAGYSMTTIREHVQTLIESGDTWVEANATEDALHRDGFVAHVMTLEPKKKVRKSGKERNVVAIEEKHTQVEI